MKQTDPDAQVREVLDVFDLRAHVAPMTRCLVCNGVVQNVVKILIEFQVDKKNFETHPEFTQCSGCGKIYWKGSHYDSMMQWIKNLMG
ncbi:MAG: hypothetical protein COX19_05605 [Desulfobacterales bacterium CG23_combo_of_CG06-09_8_20_14_all_51_8]|nr:MAG: hypothetical protein COX19_05605 [Desulfobacterales bacterium CG23_combo_of_CG06-09_8_20_14_all_51_8]